MQHRFYQCFSSYGVRCTIVSLALLPASIMAELQPIDDEDLADIAGQSVIQLTQIAPCAGGATGCSTAEMVARGYTDGTPTGYDSGDLGFSRVEIGASIDINANIERLILGEYARAGFDQDADVFIDQISLGTIDPATGTLTDFSLQDPFVEFAYREDAFGQPSEIAGVRLGFKNTDGTLGSTIHTLSGDFQVQAPGIPITALGIDLGTINIQAEGHAPRQTSLFVGQDGVSGDSGIIGFLFDNPLGASIGAALAANQATNQYHTIQNNQSNNFYLSAANQQIFYPRIGEGLQGPAQAGYWINLQDNVVLPNVSVPDATAFDFQGGNPYPINCFNGVNGNTGIFSGC